MNWFAKLILRLLPASVVNELPEDRVQRGLDRGRRSAGLLADEVLTEAFDSIEARLTDQWRATPSHSKDEREALFHQVAAVQSVRAQLKAWSDDAKFVAAQIEKRR